MDYYLIAMLALAFAAMVTYSVAMVRLHKNLFNHLELLKKGK
jgi:hypothetical protein